MVFFFWQKNGWLLFRAHSILYFISSYVIHASCIEAWLAIIFDKIYRKKCSLTFFSWKCSGRNVSGISCSGLTICGWTCCRKPSSTPLNVNFFILFSLGLCFLYFGFSFFLCVCLCVNFLFLFYFSFFYVSNLLSFKQAILWVFSISLFMWF